jgi:predicted acylesterase/phospholipase RssA
MRTSGVLLVTAIALAVGACATVHNLPLNTASADPFAGTIAQAAAAAGAPREAEGAVIGLAFSGGGTRAAAFAYGVLQQLRATHSSRAGARGDLLDHVAIISSVSGGSVLSAYYGLKGRAALDDFREQFLTQDLMAELNTSITLVNVGRALGGGINTDTRLRDWLNAHLFHDATYSALIARRPIILINSTDIYSRTPFLFAPVTFAAMCSDLAEYPVAGAVAASAAVPGAFAPVIVETFPGKCTTPLPPGVAAAANGPGASPLLHSFAEALERSRTGKVKYIKLFDGSLVDNYGLSGITIARAAQGTPYGPLRPEEAVDMRRFLFLVVDAGRGPQGDWSQTLEGPTGKDLVGAVIDTILDANTRSSYQAFEETMRNWRSELVRWRCGLKADEVARLRGKSGPKNGPWNCRDLKITVARVDFDQLDAARVKKFNDVPTSFTLPADTVDELARAGGDALQANPAFQVFLKEM